MSTKIEWVIAVIADQENKNYFITNVVLKSLEEMENCQDKNANKKSTN